MTYDAAHGVVVLFGGAGTRGVDGDTWTWNGSGWLQQNPAESPPARSFAAMSYDPANLEVVLFGGVGSQGALNDTWVWGGSTWTEEHPATSPPAESSVTMTNDPVSGRPMLVGTFGSDDATWQWDGQTWTLVETFPGPFRRGYGLTSALGSTSSTLFGGVLTVYVKSRSCIATNFHETWTWDGAAWTRRSPSLAPPGRGYMGLAPDPAAGKLLLFGGAMFVSGFRACALGNVLGDTWIWTGNTWKVRQPTHSPSARYGVGMVYDPATDEIVLFGGVQLDGTRLRDTWTWGGSDWTKQSG
jgi:hypothetical protein